MYKYSKISLLYFLLNSQWFSLGPVLKFNYQMLYYRFSPLFTLFYFIALIF